MFQLLSADSGRRGPKWDQQENHLAELQSAHRLVRYSKSLLFRVPKFRGNCYKAEDDIHCTKTFAHI